MSKIKEIDISKIRSKYQTKRKVPCGIWVDEVDDTEKSLKVLAKKINELIKLTNTTNKDEIN